MHLHRWIKGRGRYFFSILDETILKLMIIIILLTDRAEIILTAVRTATFTWISSAWNLYKFRVMWI